MTRWQHFDGQGVALLESDGRVRLFVSDELAEAFAQAELDGLSADDVLNRMLDATPKRAAASDADSEADASLAEGTAPVERLVPRDWSPPHYS